MCKHIPRLTGDITNLSINDSIVYQICYNIALNTKKVKKSKENTLHLCLYVVY